MKAEIRKTKIWTELTSVWWYDAFVFKELYNFQIDSVSIIKEGLQDESSSWCDADSGLGS